jgi:hypothetical protein
LNKSAKYLKENDNFNFKEFADEVMENPDLIKSFKKYKTAYEQDYEMDIADNFAISRYGIIVIQITAQSLPHCKKPPP